MILKSNINEVHNIKYLVFDIDGTLTRWTSIPGLIQAALNYFGIPYKDDYQELLFKAIAHNEAYTILHGRASYETYGYCCIDNLPVLREYGVSGVNFATKMMELEKHFVYTNNNTKQTLQELALYYRYLGLTNWFLKPALEKLDKCELLTYFDKIYSFETNYIKPSKLSLGRILFDYKLNLEELIIIGDSKTDMSAARSAEIKSILVDYDNNKQDIWDSADAVITDFSDLKKVLVKKR